MNNHSVVGAKIKGIRETKNLSIEEIAERSGLTVDQINSIENDVNLPSLGPLIKIARALGVRLGTFMDDNDDLGPIVTRAKDREADSSISAHEGEEFIYVMQGEVEIVYGKETYHLNEGDSIFYDSIVKHHVHGAPGKSAKILAVVYIPF